MEGTVEQQLERLRSWILDRHPDREDLGLDTDLLDGVLVDSMEFIAFLVFVEEVRGQPIAAEEIDRESFRSLNAIREAYLTTQVASG